MRRARSSTIRHAVPHHVDTRHMAADTSAALPAGRWFVRLAAAPALLAGCAHIEFDVDKGQGLAYYEPVPYLLVVPDAQCNLTATLLMLPGEKKHLKFADGYGAADLKVTLSNGMITEVGQNVNNQIPDTLTALAALKTAGVALMQNGGSACDSAMLYPIVNGVVDTAHAIPLRANAPKP